MVDHEFDAAPDPQALRGLKVPGIFLIILATLSLILTLIFFFSGPAIAHWFVDMGRDIALNSESMSEEERQDMLDQMDQLEEQLGGDAASQYGILNLVQTGVALLISLLVLVGGVQMITGGSWGLAMTGTILALIPCFGPCCGLTLPFGIWGLVVLLKDDVKRAMG